MRIVGADGDRYVVEDADEFGSGPRLLDPTEAATVYGLTEPPARASEADGWKRVAADLRTSRAILPEVPLSPEARFKAGTADPVNVPDHDGDEPRRWPNFRAKVERARLNKGLTLRELAAELGCSHSASSVMPRRARTSSACGSRPSCSRSSCSTPSHSSARRLRYGISHVRMAKISSVFAAMYATKPGRAEARRPPQPVRNPKRRTVLMVGCDSFWPSGPRSLT